MILKFQIKDRDIAGRLGEIELHGKKVQTPFIFPVINPKKPIITAKEISKKFNLNVLMTNAYIIYRDPVLREAMLKSDIHNVLEFKGIIETDSGSYQILHYKKDLEITNKEIVEFQVRIGSDIINVLDLPTDIDATYEKAKEELNITLNRIREGIALRDGKAINGAIQGGIFTELRKEAAIQVSNLDVDIFAVGTIVPYLVNYEFKKLFELVMAARIHLPLNKPAHLFGVGHPLIMPLSVALGFDIFDSASYALYAYDKRYMTPFGTERLEKMQELPCSCPICSKYTVKELKEDVKLLAEHNLWILIQEIKAIRNSIKQGTLWELVILKAHAHPKVYEATKYIMAEFYKWLKALDPIRKKSGILWQGELTELRSDVRRVTERIKERINLKDLEYLYDYIWPLNQFEPKSKGPVAQG